MEMRLGGVLEAYITFFTPAEAVLVTVAIEGGGEEI